MHRKKNQKGEFLYPKQEGRKKQKAFNKSKGRGTSNLVHPQKNIASKSVTGAVTAGHRSVCCSKNTKDELGIQIHRTSSSSSLGSSIIVPVLPLLLCLHVLRLVLHRRQKSQTAKKDEYHDDFLSLPPPLLFSGRPCVSLVSEKERVVSELAWDSPSICKGTKITKQRKK